MVQPSAQMSDQTPAYRSKIASGARWENGVPIPSADGFFEKKDWPKSMTLISSLSHCESMLDISAGSIKYVGADVRLSGPEIVITLSLIGWPSL